MRISDNDYQFLDELTFLTTKKKLIRGEFLSQDENYIYYDGDARNKAICFHEIGHFLSSSKEDRIKDNLGLPREPSFAEDIIFKEILAVKYSRILFSKWLENLKLTTPKDLIFDYINYLVRDIFQPYIIEFDEKEIPYIWKYESAMIHIVDKSLIEMGTSLKEVHEYLNNIEV